MPKALPLLELVAGESGVLVGVGDSSAPFLQYLNSLHLELGSTIEVKQHFDFDHSVSVVLNGQSQTVSKAVAQNLLIQKAG